MLQQDLTCVDYNFISFHLLYMKPTDNHDVEVLVCKVVKFS